MKIKTKIKMKIKIKEWTQKNKTTKFIKSKTNVKTNVKIDNDQFILKRTSLINIQRK